MKRRTVLGPFGPLPGFGLSLGLTLFYLAVFVLAPLAAVALRPWELGAEGVWRTLMAPRTLAALRLSFGAAFFAASINLVFGAAVAWTLTRYRFPGRRLLDALVDLPFALPTAVAGVALAAVYGPHGPIGGLLAPHGIQIAFTPSGVMLALVFVGFPFVVRTLQPVLADMDPDVEEAAATLGASRLTTLLKVVAPTLAPAAISGFALAFARAVGEYGSVIFIAGNLPFKSEIAPLLIFIRLDEFDYAGAAAVGLAMLLGSFVILFTLNRLQTAMFGWGRA